MNFKERFLTAMNHEEPDQVPVMGLIMDPATVNSILGRKPTDFVGLLHKPLLGYPIKALLNTNWFWNNMYYSNTAGALEGAIKLGFDANWTIYAIMKLYKDSRASSGWSWYDPFGRIWDLAADADSNIAVNYSRALCDTEDKWEQWVQKRAPLFEDMITSIVSFHKKLNSYGDRIYPIGYAAPGIFENSWQPIGFVNFTKYVYQKPEFVRKIIDFHTDLYLRSLDAVMQSGIEVVLGGDDLGQKTGPMMRPDLIEKLLGESYRKVSQFVHSKNRKFIFHCCGNIYALLDKFIEWGFDGIITMEPTAGMELGRVREQVGHKLVLIGNLDVSYLMVKGTQQEMEDAVKKAIRDASKGGGYILSTSHSHPAVDPIRLKWMVDAAHKYGKYPISL
jgi:hypothetical protein